MDTGAKIKATTDELRDTLTALVGRVLVREVEYDLTRDPGEVDMKRLSAMYSLFKDLCEVRKTFGEEQTIRVIFDADTGEFAQ